MNMFLLLLLLGGLKRVNDLILWRRAPNPPGAMMLFLGLCIVTKFLNASLFIMTPVDQEN